MTLIGYARCSTTEQNTDDQERRLREAGCSRVFVDLGVSGKLAQRPEWDRCLDRLESGDKLVITKLDRAGRSTRHLLELVETLAARGVELLILDQSIDTSTPMGRMFYTIMAAVAEFERELLIERTHEGLRTARLAGKRPGPKEKLSEGDQQTVRFLHSQGKTIVEIAETYQVSRPVIYRVLSKAP